MLPCFRSSLIPVCVPPPHPINSGLGGRKIAAVAAGMNHSLVLTSGGVVLACGDGSDGKLGQAGGERGLVR